MAAHAAATPLCLQPRSRSEDVSLVAHRKLGFQTQRNQKKRKWQFLLLRNMTVRGRVYFEWAERYLTQQDLRNARITAEEDFRLPCGPFYIAACHQLHDLLEVINVMETFWSQKTDARP